jgi:hypothetical protein
VPEIPFSFDDPTLTIAAYTSGVKGYLSGLVDDGLTSSAEAGWLLASAIRAYVDSHSH